MKFFAMGLILVTTFAFVSLETSKNRDYCNITCSVPAAAHDVSDGLVLGDLVGGEADLAAARDALAVRHERRHGRALARQQRATEVLPHTQTRTHSSWYNPYGKRTIKTTTLNIHL